MKSHTTYDPAAQRARALALANKRRLERVELRTAVKAGKVPLIELLQDPPPAILKVRIIDLLTWQRGIGSSKASAMCRDLGISSTLSVGRTGEATRLRVVEELSAWRYVRDARVAKVERRRALRDEDGGASVAA